MDNSKHEINGEISAKKSFRKIYNLMVKILFDNKNIKRTFLHGL